MVGGLLPIPSSISVGHNQSTSRIVTLTFLNEKCEQRIRVRHANGTPTLNLLPPQRKSDQLVKILTPNV